jgi:hypothetical protein
MNPSGVLEGVVNPLSKHVGKPAIAGIASPIEAKKVVNEPLIQKVPAVATRFSAGVFGGALLPEAKDAMK